MINRHALRQQKRNNRARNDFLLNRSDQYKVVHGSGAAAAPPAGDPTNAISDSSGFTLVDSSGFILVDNNDN